MAATSRTIKVIFDGTVAKLSAASKQAERLIKSVDDKTTAFNKNLDNSQGLQNFSTRLLKVFTVAGAGAATILSLSSATSVLLSVIGSLTPGLLALPGILLGGAAAFGVFKLATLGVTDALKGDAEALAQLSPNARAAVETIRAFKTEFDDLRKLVQDKFFTGFSDEVKALGSTYFPLLRTHLAPIAIGLNSIFVSAAQAARTPFFTGSVTQILGNTSVALDNMRNSLANALTGFIGLGTVGAQYLPTIGTAIDNVAARFNAWVQEGLQSGKIQAFVDGAIAALKQLGEIASNVGGILKAIFTGLDAGATGGLLDGIVKTTAAIKEFLNTAQAQSALQALGHLVVVVGEAFRGVLLTALQQLTPVIIAAAPFLEQLATTLGATLVSALQILGPLLLQIATFLSNNAEAAAILTTVLLGIGAAAIVIAKVAAIVSTIAAAFGAVASVAGPVIGFFSSIGSAIAAVIGVLGGWSGIWAGIVVVVKAAGAAILGVVSAPVAIIAAVIAAIVGLFALAYTQIEGFRNFVDGVVDAVGSAFSTAFSAIGNFFSNFGSNMSAIGSSIGNFFTSTIPSAISSAFSAVGSFFSGIGSSVAGFVSSAVSAVGNFFSQLPAKAGEVVNAIGAFFEQLPYRIGYAIGALIGIVVTGFQNLWNGAVQITTTAITAVVTFFTNLPAQIGAILTTLVTTVGTFFTNLWNSAVQLTTAGVQAVVQFVTTLPARVMAGVNSLLSTLGSFFTNLWNNAKNIFTTSINAIIQFVTTMPGRVVSALSSLASSLMTTATNALNTFKNAVINGFNATVDFVKSIPGKIVSAIGNLGGLLVSAGRALIDGLLAGIKAGYQSMISFVSGIADGIAAHKGPLPYDRKLLIPAGIAIMQGLLEGLKRSHSEVLAWVDGVASIIQSRLSGQISPTMAFSSAAGPASRLINGVIPAPSDQRVTLADSVADAVAAALTKQPPQPINLGLRVDDAGLQKFIELIIENKDRDTVRDVLAGAGVSFGS